MTTNPNHYSNCAREPHAGDIACHNATSQEFKVSHSAFVALNYKMVTPWWDVDAKPGDRVKDRDGDVWTLRANGKWSIFRGEAIVEALWIEGECGPCEPVKVEPRPTSPTDCARCDRIEAYALGIEGLLGRRRDQLAKAREEIDRLKARIDELDAANPEPGPLLRGTVLAAILPTLKAGDIVEVEHDGHKATGELWPEHRCLMLWVGVVRTATGKPGAYVDALRVIERAPEPEPEPGADIPDEVVAAAVEAATREWDSGRSVAYSEAMRIALAAADAKRAELDGGVR